MTDTLERHQISVPPAFWKALGLNFVWINVSEVARYFGVVKPMLHEAFPGADHIAAVSPGIFASWMVWDAILILAATGFYWMCLQQFGASLRAVIIGASSFTLTVFGLIWLGIVNMGLTSSDFIWAAMPLAWLEQLIAAFIVYWVMQRQPALN